MKLITCPNTLDEELEKDNRLFSWPRVFLAGGITNCPDWQSQVIKDLDSINQLIVFNPRRPDFNISNTIMEQKQIAWEHFHIMRSTRLLFWFPKETLCPITLLELGKALGLFISITVGCHPEYKRRIDVIEQIKHMDPDVVVQNDLESTVKLFRHQYERFY